MGCLEDGLQSDQHANCNARAPSDDDVRDEEDGLKFADLQRPGIGTEPGFRNFSVSVPASNKISTIDSCYSTIVMI